MSKNHAQDNLTKVHVFNPEIEKIRSDNNDMHTVREELRGKLHFFKKSLKCLVFLLAFAVLFGYIKCRQF